jgi:hypothetical protein
MSDIAPMIDMAKSWLTGKQAEPRLRPKLPYSLDDPGTPEVHRGENARIGRLAWTLLPFLSETEYAGFAASTRGRDFVLFASLRSGKI